ncbi:MAG: hypothetical protein AAGE52_38935 [Myxococcota bacterium]
MLAGHYATALVAKQKAPEGSLFFFLVASQFPDLLWLVFHYLGLEPTLPTDVLDVSLGALVVEMTYSHDLIPILVWTAVIAGAGYGLYRSRRVALVGAGLVGIHAMTDYLAGYPHSVMGDGTPRIATGMYYSAPYVAVAFEALYTTIFLGWFFHNARKAGARTRRGAIFGIFIFGLIFMVSVAAKSYRELFGIPSFELGFATTIPALAVTYASLILVLVRVVDSPAEEPLAEPSP